MGPYHFTIAVAEYTVDGWKNRLAVATGVRELVAGNKSEEKTAAGTEITWGSFSL